MTAYLPPPPGGEVAAGGVTAEIDEKLGRIAITSPWSAKELLADIPGSKWNQQAGKWLVPISWSSCLALRSSFGAGLTIGPALADWATSRKENIDILMYLRTLTDRPGSFPDADDLFGWQRSGSEFILYGKRVLIADDPGAGKTASVIKGLQRLQLAADAKHELGAPVFPLLIVCPNSMKQTWKREFDRWYPGNKVVVVSGSAAKRRKIFDEGADVYVMNFESVKGHSSLSPYGSVAMTRCQEHGGESEKITPARCHVHPKELNAIEFQSVVVDEAHRIAEGKSAQTRAIKKAAGNAPIRIAMTGTPQKNDVTDLWSILNFIEPDEFPSKTKWIGRNVEFMLNAFGGMVVIGVKAQRQAEFNQILDSRMRRMTEDVVLSFLPPIIYQRRDIELSPKQKKAYDEMSNTLQAEFDGKLLTADSPMTKATRLLQLASSYGEVEVETYIDEHGFPAAKHHLRLSDPSSKLDAFMDDLDDFGDKQVAVMAVSRQLIELLSARLTKKKVPHGLITGATSEWERQEAMDKFQAGQLQFILFTTAAGGTGITLTAARYLVRLQLPYSFVDFQQSLRRVRRIGAEKHDNIIVVDYVTRGTLDTHTFEVLQVKGESFEDTIRDRAAFEAFIRADNAARKEA